MIERAARDPSIDIDKLDRLLLMRERENARVAEQTFNAAMAAAQAEMEPPSVTVLRGLRSIPCPRNLSCDLVWIRPSDRFELLQPTCEAIGQVQITEFDPL